MSHTQIATSLALELITDITGIDSESDPQNFALCRNFTIKNIRSNVHSRPNKFVVRERLEGLVEKFRVKNNDNLADELHSLLRELDGRKYELKPEILMLLLELSVNPVRIGDEIVDKLDAIRKAAQEELLTIKQLNWKDIHGDGAASSEEENLWRDVDYGDESDYSDWDEDDDGALFSKISKEKKAKPTASSRKQAGDEEEEEAGDDFAGEVEQYIENVNRRAMDNLSKYQYWANKISISSKEMDAPVNVNLRAEVRAKLWSVTEIQAVREVIFHLHGLPTNLFEVSNNSKVTVNKQYALKHTSLEGFTALLSWFGESGSHLTNIRDYVKLNISQGRQPNGSSKKGCASKQTFIAELENSLSTWEGEVLVPEEDKFVVGQVNRGPTGYACLMGLQETLEPSLRPLIVLSQVITGLTKASEDDDDDDMKSTSSEYRHLELLYDKACELQSIGSLEEFKVIASIFLSVLNTYLRPAILWMQSGEISEYKDTYNFFIKFNKENPDSINELSGDLWLRDLWQGKCTLKRSQPNGKVMMPSFLSAHCNKIYVTGKSILFLRYLKDDAQSQSVVSPKTSSAIVNLKLSFESVCTETDILSPFNELLSTIISNWIDTAHYEISAELRDTLYYECGLWHSLDALSSLFFMRDGYAMTSFSTAIFDKIDSGRKGWDDRFLLTELLQSMCIDNPVIDISKLSVRSKREKFSLLPKQTEKVQTRASLTDLLVLDYRLSWPVMNVLQADSIETYRRVWSFMLMLCRAKSALIKLRLGRSIDEPKMETGNGFYLIKWKLLVFVNVKFHYLTDLVLWPQTVAMKEQLSAALDIDGLIEAHKIHINRIRDLCLLGEKFIPLYEAIRSIVELALLFYEVQRHDRADLIDNKTSKPKSKRKEDSSDDSEDDDDDEEADDDDNETDTESVATKEGQEIFEKSAKTDIIEVEGKSHEELMAAISKKFDELHAFLINGLRGIARAGVYPEIMDGLAESLDTENNDNNAMKLS